MLREPNGSYKRYSADVILVTGATGRVGGAVVARLAELGAETRVLIRPGNDPTALTGKGVGVAIGDFDSPESLPHAVAGVSTALLICPPGRTQTRREAAFVDACVTAGVRRIVKLSMMGDGAQLPKVIAAHRIGEALVQASGLEWTIVRPTFFLRNFLDFAPSIRAEGRIYAFVGSGKVAPIAVHDVAAICAVVLTTAGHSGEIYEATGPEALDYNQAAQILSRALGRPVAYREIPPDDLAERLHREGYDAWAIDRRLEFDAFIRRGLAERTTDTVRRLARTRPVSFTEFAAHFRERFLAQTA